LLQPYPLLHVPSFGPSSASVPQFQYGSASYGGLSATGGGPPAGCGLAAS